MRENKEQKIIKELLRIGFNKYEAKAYVTLLRNPNVTAYEISKISGVPQSKIYETMKKLVNRGLSIAKGKKPVKYTALSIEEYLDRYKNDLDESIKYIKDNFKELEVQPTIEHMWHFKGKHQIHSKIKDMINKAKESLYLELWTDEYNKFFDEILEANERGVYIVIVLYGKTDKEIGKVYYHELNGIKESAEKHGRWLNIISDEKECLFSIMKPGEINGIWTQNKAFMILAESFISHDIYIAEIYKKFKKELDETFGPNMKKIRENIHIG
ncbi:MAG: TrmB family transcriptional regulator [Firmicutes bacterium]|nr:TrmB family transcriptional regulator [Bacillota bacterium]